MLSVPFTLRQATLATSTQIVWTYVFEMAFLHETLNAWSVAGTGLILGYMLVVAAMKYASSRASTDAMESEQTRLLTAAENGTSGNYNNGPALSVGVNNSESME